MHEWKYNLSDRPQIVANELGELFLDKEEPTENLITWIFDEGSFVPSAKITKDDTFSIVSDYLGTPCLMYNGVGNLVWQTDLDIFGKVRTLSKGNINDCPFRYQGQYHDTEVELYYNRFRYYSSESGTYISQDPIGLVGGDALYTYVTDINSVTDALGLASSVFAEMQSYVFSDTWLKGPHANIQGPNGKLAEAFLESSDGKLKWVLKHDKNVPKKLRKQVQKVVSEMLNDDALMKIAKEQTENLIKDLGNQTSKKMKEVAKRNLPRFEDILKLFCK